jgi:hypothetical protein
MLCTDNCKYKIEIDGEGRSKGLYLPVYNKTYKNLCYSKSWPSPEAETTKIKGRSDLLAIMFIDRFTEGCLRGQMNEHIQINWTNCKWYKMSFRMHAISFHH